MALMMLGAMAVDAAIGWPAWLYRAIGHPVTWLGRVISALERRLNTGKRARRIAAGALCCGAVLCVAGLPALVLFQQVLCPVPGFHFNNRRKLNIRMATHIDRVGQYAMDGTLGPEGPSTWGFDPPGL